MCRAAAYWLAAASVGQAAQATACGATVPLAGVRTPTASSAGLPGPARRPTSNAAATTAPRRPASALTCGSVASVGPAGEPIWVRSAPVPPNAASVPLARTVAITSVKYEPLPAAAVSGGAASARPSGFQPSLVMWLVTRGASWPPSIRVSVAGGEPAVIAKLSLARSRPVSGSACA